MNWLRIYTPEGYWPENYWPEMQTIPATQIFNGSVRGVGNTGAARGVGYTGTVRTAGDIEDL
jgi:hypothetical protein